MTSWFVRDCNHDIGGSRAVNQLVQTIEPADNGNRIRLRMNCQVATTKLGAGCLLMAGVHEADDHHPSAGALAHLLQQLPGIATGADEDDPRPRESPAHIRIVPPPKFQGILHELPPIRRSVARNAGAFGPFLPRGTIHGHHASPAGLIQVFHRRYRRNSPGNPFNRQLGLDPPRGRDEVFCVNASQVQQTPIWPAGRPRLTVIIVNYNGWPDVLQLVSALVAEPEFGSGELQVVVVDNASPDPIPERLWLYSPSRLRVLVRPDNGGFAVGVNAGWRLARSDWLLVLNPDVEIARGLISQVIERIERFDGQPCRPPGIVGFALKNPDGSTRAPSASSPASGERSPSSSYRARAGNTRPVGEFSPDRSTG